MGTSRTTCRHCINTAMSNMSRYSLRKIGVTPRGVTLTSMCACDYREASGTGNYEDGREYDLCSINQNGGKEERMLIKSRTVTIFSVPRAEFPFRVKRSEHSKHL